MGIYGDGYRAAPAASFPVGAMLACEAATPPAGWLMCDGKTIGSADSGAIARANADTWALFELIWNSFSNELRAIQAADGSPGARGESAAADFAAGMRLPLPDARGRLLGCAGEGTGLTARAAGAAAGAESVQLSADQLPAAGVGQDAATITGLTGINVASGQDATAASAVAGSTGGTTAALGEGAPVSIVPPSYFTNWMIKY